LDGQDREFHRPSTNAKFDPEGRFVVFIVGAPGSDTGSPLTFLRDTCFSIDHSCVPSTTLLTTRSADGLMNSRDMQTSFSPSARFIAMAPEEGPRPNSANWVAAVIRDKCTGMEAPCVPSIVRVPLTPDGTAPNGATLAVTQSNSGRYFAFISRAS